MRLRAAGVACMRVAWMRVASLRIASQHNDAKRTGAPSAEPNGKLPFLCSPKRGAANADRMCGHTVAFAQRAGQPFYHMTSPHGTGLKLRAVEWGVLRRSSVAICARLTQYNAPRVEALRELPCSCSVKNRNLQSRMHPAAYPLGKAHVAHTLGNASRIVPPGVGICRLRTADVRGQCPRANP